MIAVFRRLRRGCTLRHFPARKSCMVIRATQAARRKRDPRHLDPAAHRYGLPNPTRRDGHETEVPMKHVAQ